MWTRSGLHYRPSQALLSSDDELEIPIMPADDPVPYSPLGEGHSCVDNMCVNRTSLERKLIVVMMIMAATIIGLIIGLAALSQEYQNMAAHTSTPAPVTKPTLPTPAPTHQPTPAPTHKPTPAPTHQPTPAPPANTTIHPTSSTTKPPVTTQGPTSSSTHAPTAAPTKPPSTEVPTTPSTPPGQPITNATGAPPSSSTAAPTTAPPASTSEKPTPHPAPPHPTTQKPEPTTSAGTLAGLMSIPLIVSSFVALFATK